MRDRWRVGGLIGFACVVAGGLPGVADARVLLVSSSSLSARWASVAVVFGEDDDRIVVSADGGRHFGAVPAPRAGVEPVALLPSGLGYAVRRGSGQIWRTGNGGRGWHATAERGAESVQAVATSVWAVERRGGRTYIARSGDGGRHWHHRRAAAAHAEGSAVRLSFADAADGVLSGLQAERAGGGTFMEFTRDGGRTWTRRPQAPCSDGFTAYKYAPAVQWLASGAIWLACSGESGAGEDSLEIKESLDAGRTFALLARSTETTKSAKRRRLQR